MVATVQTPAQKRVLKFYTYTVTSLALAAAGIANPSLQIEANSDFWLHKMTYFADIAAAAQTQSTQVIPLVTILINDTGTGENLMNAAVPINSIMGMGGSLPFILPYPRKIAANSTLQITLTNFSAATTYNLRLAFIGVKDYPFGGLNV